MNQYQTAFANTQEQWLVDAEDGFIQPFRDKAVGTRLSPVNWYQRYWLDRMLYEGSAGGEIYPNWIRPPNDIPPGISAYQVGLYGDVVCVITSTDLYPAEDWSYAISLKAASDGPIIYKSPSVGTEVFEIPLQPGRSSEGVMYWSILRKGYLKSPRNFVDFEIVPF